MNGILWQLFFLNDAENNSDIIDIILDYSTMIFTVKIA